jgi:hypothetical protein
VTCILLTSTAAPLPVCPTETFISRAPIELIAILIDKYSLGKTAHSPGVVEVGTACGQGQPVVIFYQLFTGIYREGRLSGLRLREAQVGRAHDVVHRE